MTRTTKRQDQMGIYFMVRHVDISSLLIRSKHCENESGDCIFPGRLYVSYHEVYTKYTTRCMYFHTRTLFFKSWKSGSNPIRSDPTTKQLYPIRSEMILPDPKSEKIRSDRIRIGFGSDLHISSSYKQPSQTQRKKLVITHV